MKIVQFGITMMLGIGLIGCSGGIPECGDEEATDLVLSIVKEEMEKQIGKEIADLLRYKLSSIRTTDTHQKTGAYSCSAQLEMHGIKTGKTNMLPITYTIEKTDNGREFFISVYGLN